MQELLTIQEIAFRLRVKDKTIRKWVKEKKIPYIRASFKILRFDWEDVKEAVKKMGVANG